jgi:beta-glucosidase
VTTPALIDHTQRAREIVDGLPLDQQVGLLLHPIIVIDESTQPDASSGFGGPTFRQLITDHGIRFFCLGNIPNPAVTRTILDRLQEIAQSSGSRLPAVFSTDPRHSFVQNEGAAHRAQGVSQWPENLGLGAIGDADLVRRYAAIVRRDYLAMGIRMALHPQIDLTTEPRWGRQAQSFGADPTETGRLVTAFLEGLQGGQLGAESVAGTVKHFPGGGPQRDGEDPHFPYGREQVYPGGRFDDHLAPFRSAIAAGAAAIMPYYGMPVGLILDGEPVEEVGFAFNRQIITGLLRDQLGYDGVVLSDFGLVTDMEINGKPFPARAWGVEELTPIERVAKIFHAGVDQLGGELNPDLLLDAVTQGLITPAQVQTAATRIVTLMLRLGLLSQPGPLSVTVDELPLPADVELAERAQARAVTVLTNGSDEPLLPLAGARRVHLVNVSAEAIPDGWIATGPDEADIAIVRLSAPFEHRDHYFLESGMQQGSLQFAADVVDDVIALSQKVPVVLTVTLNRPAILTPFLPVAAAILGEFGVSDSVLLRVLTGDLDAEGHLPFELPRDMAAVQRSAPDTPNDTENPLFKAGWGLTLAGMALPEAP